MIPSHTYAIDAFARLAGVTVRALQSYDDTGLLRPIRRMASQVRQYRMQDLLRLQQLLTLKALGFMLADVCLLLEHPTYDVAASLRIQQEALDRRRAQLARASHALARTLERLDATRDPDRVELVTIIRAVGADDRHEWRRRYGIDL